MKTFEFKLSLSQEKISQIDNWLDILKVVWNRAIAILEWKQYHDRRQKCLETEWEDTWGFDLKPVGINVTKVGKDWIYYSTIAAQFRKDKAKGWEVNDNIDVRLRYLVVK